MIFTPTKDGKEIRLTNDKDREVNPVVSPDGNYVAFTKNNNLYSVNINTQKETQPPLTAVM